MIVSVKSRVAGCSLALATLVAAQDPSFVMVGKSDNAQYGSAITRCGDVDGDGRVDFVVGAPIDQRVTEKSGAVEVRSGAGWKLLYTWLGPGKGDELGFAVAGAGDVDADGADDVIVSCLGGKGPERSFIGHARVYSGKDGHRLHTFAGEMPYDFHGLSVAGVTDLDGDGHAEVAVAAPGADLAEKNTGFLNVHSGKTGEVLHRFEGENGGCQYGWFCRPVGDHDGDGIEELLIGSPSHLIEGKLGYAELRSGKGGELLRRFEGEKVEGSDGDRFGWSLIAVGDMDGDGATDFAISAPKHDAGGEDAGAVYVFSGKTGERLHFWSCDEAGAWFGWSVDSNGDVDGDGTPDLWITAPHSNVNGEWSGTTYLYSGKTGERLLEIKGRSSKDESGYAVCDLGEVEPGVREVLVGARSDDVPTGQMIGSVGVYRVARTGDDRLVRVVPGDATVETWTEADIAPDEIVEIIDPPKGRLPFVIGGGAVLFVAVVGLALFRRRG